MIKLIHYKLLFSVTALFVISSACSDTSTGPEPGDLTGEYVSYELDATGDSELTGTLTFAERVNGFTEVTVDLSEVPEEKEYTVQLNSGTILQGGDLLIKLEPVDESGESVTNVSADAEGNAVSYDDLIGINGHVNVYPSEHETETILAQADVGGNKLTEEALVFNVEEENESAITGSVEFLERINGNILAVIELSGADPAQTHIARLYSAGDEENDNGEHLFTFSGIDGESGISHTDFNELNNETEFLFDDLKEFKGTVHIYFSEDDLNLLATATIEPEEEIDE